MAISTYAELQTAIGNWLGRNARPGRGENVSRAMPPKTIPTFSVENIARKGFFYAGGEYWGEGDRRVMRGAMYTEVWVPRQIRHPNPVVLFHGNGQTGVDWQMRVVAVRRPERAIQQQPVGSRDATQLHLCNARHASSSCGGFSILDFGFSIQSVGECPLSSPHITVAADVKNDGPRIAYQPSGPFPHRP